MAESAFAGYGRRLRRFPGPRGPGKPPRPGPIVMNVARGWVLSDPEAVPRVRACPTIELETFAATARATRSCSRTDISRARATTERLLCPARSAATCGCSARSRVRRFVDRTEMAIEDQLEHRRVLQRSGDDVRIGRRAIHQHVCAPNRRDGFTADAAGSWTNANVRANELFEMRCQQGRRTSCRGLRRR